MRLFLLLIALLTSLFSFGQMRPIGKVYIVEGMVADRETLQAVPHAILYNDLLGIVTTSDENGYFKLVAPNALIEKGPIYFNVVKPGFKRTGLGFRYNAEAADTTASKVNSDTLFSWHNGIEIIWLVKDNSPLSSGSGVYMSPKAGVHGYPIIKSTFDEIVASEIRDMKFAQLKQGNEKIYFPLDNATGLATSRYNIIVLGKLTHVFIEGRKVKLTHINKVAKRSEVAYDRKTSDSLSKQYGKETLVFTKAPKSGTTPDKSWTIDATLIIEVGN